jgi:hypothetical protein
MKTLELFSGTESFSKVAFSMGHEIFTVELLPEFNPNLVGNILDEHIQKQIQDQLKTVDLVWMSPVCTAWTLAAGNTHWTKYRMPKTMLALDSIKMMMYCRYIADYCEKNGKYFVIENPNGRAVWIMDNKWLNRVWYCQYGDKRAKPTNIWSNIPNLNLKTCFNGNKNCHHEAAPRGSKTGTQSSNCSVERSVIPPLLIKHIIKKVEGEGSERAE